MRHVYNGTDFINYVLCEICTTKLFVRRVLYFVINDKIKMFNQSLIVAPFVNCNVAFPMASIVRQPVCVTIYEHFSLKCPIVESSELPKTRHMHYIDVIMTTMASLITSLTVVYSTVYSDADQRKHQSSASLASVWGIHRSTGNSPGPVNSPHKGPVTRKMFPFDDVIMKYGFGFVRSAWTWQVSREQVHVPLTRYVKLQDAHAPGIPGTFPPTADFKGNRLLAIPACITARAPRTCRVACRDC